MPAPALNVRPSSRSRTPPGPSAPSLFDYDTDFQHPIDAPPKGKGKGKGRGKGKGKGKRKGKDTPSEASPSDSPRLEGKGKGTGKTKQSYLLPSTTHGCPFFFFAGAVRA